jgi:predicted phage terminase large subunit-like protein
MPAKRTLALKKRALTDMWAFFDLIDFKGGSSAFGEVHREFSDFVTYPQRITSSKPDGRRRVGLMPRGHLKSTVGSVGYVLWRIYRNPDIRVLFGTNIKKLARGFIRELRQYLEDTDLQATVWNARPHISGNLIPVLDAATRRRRSSGRDGAADEETDAEDKKIIWSLEALQVIRPSKFKEPTIAAVSTNTVMTGDHYDLVILDDIVDDKNSKVPSRRQDVIEWAMDMESILNTVHVSKVEGWSEVLGDEMLVMGTRYYKGDYYDYLFENAVEQEYITFFRNLYKNGRDDSDGYLWHEHITTDKVSKLRARTTPRRFASQYLNVIISEEEQIFKQSMVQWIRGNDYEIKDGFVRVIDPNDRNKRVKVRPILVVDPAISQKDSADFTVIAVGGLDTDENLYLFDMKIKRMLPTELTKTLFELADKWDVTLAYVESVGYQASIIHNVREKMRGRRPIVLRPYLPKGSKQDRIETMLQPLFENSKVWFSAWLAQLTELIDEMEYFPRAAHDDALDAVAMIRELAPKTRGDYDPGKRKQRDSGRYGVNTKYGGTRV